MDSHYIFPNLVQNASVQGAAYSDAPTLTDYLREVQGNVQLPSVSKPAQVEQYNALMGNAPWLSK